MNRYRRELGDRLLAMRLAAAGRIGTNLPLGIVHFGPWDLHPLVLVFALSGSLMISKTIRIPKP